MPEKFNNTIYPCPFSKRYGIPYQQAWLLLSVFSLYRLITSFLFVILFISRTGPSLLGSYDPQLYLYTSLSYLLLAMLFGVSIYFRKPDYTVQTQFVLFSDIVIVTLLLHSCGGITSGIGMLLAVTTAAGGLLIGGRCAMLFAALASLAVLAEQVYTSQIDPDKATAYTYAGILGASFFTIAFLSYFLARRTEQSELKVTQLEELNQYIIRQLNSGIIIVDQNQQVYLFNDAAKHLLQLDKPFEFLQQISEPLVQAFRSWMKRPSQDIAKLKCKSDIEIHSRFIPLETENKTFYMIILEDVALYNQRLQQGKLASLGQLTASIAHEIRNPLNAISHAEQLLSESNNLSPQEKRLTEIIHTHSARVNRIIEDILQLSRRNPSKRDKIELDEWLRKYFANFIEEHRLDHNDFMLEIEGRCCALIDPGHLRQILDNLLLNALKYGKRENNLIKLKVFHSKNSPCIEIIDNGPGIDPDNIERLFEPFFTTSSSGTGLGLYISKELAELNQASLSYQKETASGCSFRLCLSDATKKVIEI